MLKNQRNRKTLGSGMVHNPTSWEHKGKQISVTFRPAKATYTVKHRLKIKILNCTRDVVPWETLQLKSKLHGTRKFKVREKSIWPCQRRRFANWSRLSPHVGHGWERRLFSLVLYFDYVLTKAKETRQISIVLFTFKKKKKTHCD